MAGIPKLLKLKDVHREFARLRVAGHTRAQCAEALDVSVGACGVWSCDPLVQTEIERVRQALNDEFIEVKAASTAGAPVDVTSMARRESPKAFKAIRTLMIHAKNEKIRMEAAEDILRMAGYFKGDSGDQIMVVLGHDAIKQLIEGAREVGHTITIPKTAKVLDVVANPIIEHAQRSSTVAIDAVS